MDINICDYCNSVVDKGDSVVVCKHCYEKMRGENILHVNQYLKLSKLLGRLNDDIADMDQVLEMEWDDCENRLDEGADAKKAGDKILSIIKTQLLPALTPYQQVDVAVKCVTHIVDDVKWNEWAGRWLDTHKYGDIREMFLYIDEEQYDVPWNNVVAKAAIHALNAVASLQYVRHTSVIEAKGTVELIYKKVCVALELLEAAYQNFPFQKIIGKIPDA